jgi:hypothetical protein
MPTPSSLLIPIRIEAKFLEKDTIVCAPTADYTSLPWIDSNGNIFNGDVPFLGDSIINEPFSSRNFNLPQGVHLHFILPQFLGRPIPKNAGLPNSGDLPAAPNRWLLKKTKNSVTTYSLVQSDYIFDQDTNPGFTTAIPFKMPVVQGGNRPYCFMGKSFDDPDPSLGASIPNSFREMNVEKDEKDNVIRKHHLTVTGSGDVNFSAYYPNCHSVFGYHDKGITDLNTSIDYEVFGWNDLADDDLLSNYIKTAVTNKTSNIVGQLKTLFSVAVNSAGESDLKQITNQSIYYGRILMDGVNKNAQTPFQDLEVTIGLTGTEALAAWVSKDTGKKREVEEQLESINLYPNLNYLLGDIGPKFHEARHTQGFRRINGGHKWIISRNTSGPSATKPGGPDAASLSPLPDGLLDGLDALNKAQEAYDKGFNELVTLQEQLYMDWTKYMKALYQMDEGVDYVSYSNDFKNFISNYSVSEIQLQIDLVGNAKINTAENSVTVTTENKPTSLATNLFNQWNLLFKQQLTANNWNLQVTNAEPFWQPRPPVVLLSGLPDDGSENELLMKPGENVITIYLSDFDSSSVNTIISNLSKVDQNPIFLQNIKVLPVINYSTKTNNPFILEWEVDMNALYKGDNVDIADDIILNHTSIKPFGSDLEVLSPTKMDTQQFIGSVMMTPGSRKAMVHKISNFLKSSLASVKYEDKMILWLIGSKVKKTDLLTLAGSFGLDSDLKKLDKTSFYNNIILYTYKNDGNNLEPLVFQIIKDSDETIASNLIFILNNGIGWILLHYFETMTMFQDFKAKITGLFSKIGDSKMIDANLTFPIYYAALFALNKLVNRNFLSQALSGFNHACLMQRFTAQLPVIDPLDGNFLFIDPLSANYKSDYSEIFSEMVNKSIGNVARVSTFSDNQFYPIRFGEFNINRLNLIDNFGILTSILDNSETFQKSVTNAETLLYDKNKSCLPPRITQPARIDFRWLAADRNPAICSDPQAIYVPSNTHHLSSPICGWLVPDYFNSALMVFDPKGDALGYLDEDAHWNLPPSYSYACNIDANIENEHLHRVVKWLSGNTSLLQQFLSSMQTAQDNSSPTHTHVYSTKSLLMGKPIAVARALINIELMGLPAINQNNELFEVDCNYKVTTYKQRINNNWDEVAIPFRLGEHFQLDDGLLGYWTENNRATNDASVISDLIAPESDNNFTPSDNGNRIRTFTGNDKMQETIRINSAKVFTILLNPISGVHVTTGVLPTLKKTIDPNHFLPQMKKIQMWFKVFPLLQPDSSITGKALLNLPKIEDSTWQWYDRFGNLRPISSDEVDKLQLSTNTLTESFLILTNNQ